MKPSPNKSKIAFTISTILFLAFTAWWLYIKQFDIDATRDMRQLWGATYQIIALFGAIVGFVISKRWGGYKSMLGRAIMAFAVGLLLQSFGQTYSSYYVYSHHVESPIYPGIGDVGFFGSVIAYIYGIIALSKISGIRVSLKKMQNKAWALIIPVAILVGSYMFYLKGYEFDWSDKIKVFLDFGYPLGQAFYMSIGILALILSRNVLGGIMKKPILFLIIALLFQYFSDFFFLYEANLGVWYVGNINDFLYSASYFLMSISLIQFSVAFHRIRSTE
ncbi:MAG: hypothetical protein KBC67_00690 [Candidatus Pacebacteria bacterium]|nr:hypothetical protein [Candidatus Paceibacterota bacterium]